MTTHIHNWGNDIPLCGYEPKEPKEVVVSVDPTVQGVDEATCPECRKLYITKLFEEAARKQAEVNTQLLRWNQLDTRREITEAVEASKYGD